MAYGTVNADTLVTSTSGGILGAGNASIMKNRIINGAMVIDQRNAGASVSNTTSILYTLDRWFCYGANASSKFTVQQNAGSVTPPSGFVNYLGVTSSAATSISASDVYVIGQNIEGFNISDLGWGTANAKTVTLSFQVYSSLTGTFGGAIQNSAQNRSYPFSYTVSSANTWTTISITIAGDTSGTWLSTNGIGLRIWIGLGVGSTFSGTAGSWSGSNFVSTTGATSVVGTSGATFYITGIQLEVGSSATGYEYRLYNTELANCQRYYEQWTYGGSYGFIATGQAYSTTAIQAGLTYTVQKRTAPTISVSGATNNYSPTGSGIASTYSFSQITSSTVNINGTTASSMVAGSASNFYLTGSGSYISFSAEL